MVLTATADDGYEVKQWFSTDDNASREQINYVTMNRNRTVTVEIIEANRRILVPSEFATLDEALTYAFEGDMIIVSPGTYFID